MKIVICGSMTQYLKMIEVRDSLVAIGHDVVLPDPSGCNDIVAINNNTYVDTYALKIRYNYILKHYDHILKSDCILVTNFTKKRTKNYVGGNAFLEMGFAYILGRPIYLLNSVPKISYYYHEMKAMQPIIIKGDLRLIGSQGNKKNKKSISLRV